MSASRRQGHVGAVEFEELYRATARDVLAYVRRRTPADAEDLVAETYAVAWRRRDDLPAPPLRRAWLFGVARTLVLADHRRRGVEEEATAALPSASTTTYDRSEGSRVAVGEALARLSPTDRELLTLVTWEGLSPGEVAVALDISPGAARVRLHRARQAFAADPGVRALVEGQAGVTAVLDAERGGSQCLAR